MEEHEYITNKIARKETGIRSEGTIKEAFYRLKGKKLIEPVPGRAKSNAAWRKVGTAYEQFEDEISSYELYPNYERLIMDYLANHQKITNRVAREVTGVDSPQVMKNIFNRLRKRGLIEFVPGNSRHEAAWHKTQDG